MFDIECVEVLVVSSCPNILVHHIMVPSDYMESFRRMGVFRCRCMIQKFCKVIYRD